MHRVYNLYLGAFGQLVCTHLNIHFLHLTTGNQAQVCGIKSGLRRCAVGQVKCKDRGAKAKGAGAQQRGTPQLNE